MIRASSPLPAAAIVALPFGLGAVLVAASCLPSYDFQGPPDAGAPPSDASLVDAQGDDGHTGPADAAPDTPSDTASDAGGDAPPADAAQEGASGGCPVTQGTTPMIRFDVPTLGSFCIDVHEVTNQQFDSFVLSPSPVFTVPPICVTETVEGGLPPPSGADPSLPAGYLSMCDAWAYCSWAGKRLCGRIGGQHSSGTANVQFDEWSYACANGSAATQYPYGQTFDPTICNTGTLDAGATLQAPMSFPRCHGTDAGFDQVFDLSGNIAEYDDWASSYTFTDDSGLAVVHSLGGSYENDSPSSCDSPSTQFGQINRAFDNAGFRCCATPAP